MSRFGYEISCWAALEENEGGDFVRAEWDSSLMEFLKAYVGSFVRHAGLRTPARLQHVLEEARGTYDIWVVAFDDWDMDFDMGS